MKILPRLLAALAAAVAVSSPARAADPTATPFHFLPSRPAVELPLVSGAELLLVPVAIDGHDAYLILDTTGYTSIDAQTAKGWGIPTIKQNPFPKPATPPLGADPASTTPTVPSADPAAARVPAPPPVFDAHLLTLGSCTVSHYPFAGRDMTPFSVGGTRVVGTLGIDFLRHAPFTLDLRAGTLTLLDPARFSPPADGTLPFDLDTQLLRSIAFTVKVEGQPATLVFSSLVNRSPLVLSHSFIVHHEAMVRTRPKSLARIATAGVPHGLELYDVQWDAVGVPGRTLADLPGSYYLSASAWDAFDGLIGASAFRDARLTVDLSAGKAWVRWLDPEPLDDLVKRLTDKNRRDANGASALLRAAQLRRPDAVQKLIDVGAEPNMANRDGLTPLAAAADAGDLKSVAALLKAGAETERPDNLRGYTPLHVAVRSGRLDVVQALIEARADVNAVSGPTTFGRTPLILAAEAGRADIAKLLLDHGADVDRRSVIGLTALDFACTPVGTSVIPILLAHHADPSLTESTGMPLSFAASANAPDAIRLLIDAGAHVNAHSGDGLTPLAAAADRGALECAALLLAAGADPAEPMPDGTTALDHAIRQGNPELIRLFLAPPPSTQKPADAPPATRPGRNRYLHPSDVSLAR